MADVRLETIQRQEAPALSLGEPLQARGVGEREGEQFVRAFEARRDRPWGDSHPTGAQGLMDCRQAAVLGVAQGANPGNAIEAKLVRRQGEPSLCCRSVGMAQLGTGPVETAPDLQGDMHHIVQSRAGTIVMIGGPHRLTAEGAMTPKRLEGVGCRWGRTRRRTCHGESFPVSYSPLYQSRATDV